MFRRLGINSKLTLIALTTIVLTLLVIGVAAVHFDRNETHDAIVEELDVLSTIVADWTAAAIASNDPVVATQHLAALEARTAITAACVFDANGKLFASYRREQNNADCEQVLNKGAGEEKPDYIHIVRNVGEGEARVGELHIHSDLGDLEDRLNRIYIFLAAAALGALMLVLQVSWRLQRWVTRPLLDLSERVRTVTKDKDYSVRAVRTSDDELGVLVDAFNAMLETIQTQNRSLIEANVRLEQIVEERTAALNQAQDNLLRQERLATLGQLTGTVSHELRNPLGTIQASIDLLRSRMQNCTADIELPLERIVRNIRRCENIINELLDYSRGSPPHLLDVPVDDWLEEIVGSYADDEFLPITLASELDISVEMDPDRMRRVITNLVDNARHALMEAEAEPNQPSIAVRSVLRDNRLWIEVTDNGPGIPDELLPRIFEPLFSTRAFGVGLGLPIVKQILDQHNGGIEVSSRVGQGTSVRVWLPVRENSQRNAEGSDA